MFKYFAIGGGLVVLLIFVFIFWRLTSVGRGARKRDEKLLLRIDPVAEKISKYESVSQEEINALAAHPENRIMLFAMLRELGKPELLPQVYSSTIAQGESALVYWMMHPNELQDAPEIIEHIDTQQRQVDAMEADFHVYRYKMAEGHWAAKDGWGLGVAGPFIGNAEPYTELPGAFSRAGDVEGMVTPADLIDWYVGMLRQKGLIQ